MKPGYAREQNSSSDVRATTASIAPRYARAAAGEVLDTRDLRSHLGTQHRSHARGVPDLAAVRCDANLAKASGNLSERGAGIVHTNRLGQRSLFARFGN